jgi:GNAT superfamily N-acetyltransferase
VTSPAPLEIRQETAAALGDHASISIAFEVRTILAVEVDGNASTGFHLAERPVDRPYLKRYDDDPDEHPTAWPRRFDVSRWGFLGAYRNGERMGGAVIARDTDPVRLLDGRRDLALLWDIRVATTARGQGIGTALFRAAEAWSMRHGCSTLAVETQNVNVPACRFYAAQGCVLGAINRFAYPTLPEEVQLVWYKGLGP